MVSNPHQANFLPLDSGLLLPLRTWAGVRNALGECEMNWEAVSAVAEWLGVILVVISLGYVAMQIHQNTESVRAATELDTGRQWSEFHARVAHSDEMADIWAQSPPSAFSLPAAPQSPRRPAGPRDS